MKTLRIIVPAGKINKEVTRVKVRKGRLAKAFLVLFMLCWIFLLSSCFVRGPGHERHELRNEHHDNHDNHEHHDHDNHDDHH
jgi:hypothetical protein